MACCSGALELRAGALLAAGALDGQKGPTASLCAVALEEGKEIEGRLMSFDGERKRCAGVMEELLQRGR